MLCRKVSSRRRRGRDCARKGENSKSAFIGSIFEHFMSFCFIFPNNDEGIETSSNVCTHGVVESVLLGQLAMLLFALLCAINLSLRT